VDDVGVPLAKVAGLLKVVGSRLALGGRFFDPPSVTDYFKQYSVLREQLAVAQPDLYGDLVAREMPKSSGTSDFDGRGYIVVDSLRELQRDLTYILEVWSNHRIGVAAKQPTRIFVSHGRPLDWLKVQAYIEKDIHIPTLELAQEANKGRTLLQKLDEESDRCSYAVIVMTGDDDFGDGTVRARENVMHEIGFFQGKYGLGRVCLLYQQGTSIPTNIQGLAYIPYAKDGIEATFGLLLRELNAAFGPIENTRTSP
jgi:predicted nucleotide-binding protein